MIVLREKAHKGMFSHFPFRLPSGKSGNSVEKKRAPFMFIYILNMCISTLD
jgi:hypothetical protein